MVSFNSLSHQGHWYVPLLRMLIDECYCMYPKPCILDANASEAQADESNSDEEILGFDAAPRVFREP